MELRKKIILLLPLTFILAISLFYFFDFQELFTFEKVFQNYVKFKEYSNKNIIYSYGIFSISSSLNPTGACIVICCSLPVPLSLAETLIIPLASISNVTSI